MKGEYMTNLKKVCQDKYQRHNWTDGDLEKNAVFGETTNTIGRCHKYNFTCKRCGAKREKWLDGGSKHPLVIWKIKVSCHKCGKGWEAVTDRPRITCPECGANTSVSGNENNSAPKGRKGKCHCPKCGNRWDPTTKSLRLTCTWCYKTIMRKKVE